MSDQLNEQLIEIKSFIYKGDLINDKVSKKGTYWHIDHSLQILNSICEVLEHSNPGDYQPKFSFTKFIIMKTGYIPRGKGRAPKQTLPQNIKTKEDLLTELNKAVNAIKSLDALPSNKTFRHPLFGWLNLEDTIKFMGIHTHHHIKILRDIVK
ncbi:hypothetical protein [Nonlabens sp.]|uniref:hypothetical protein n=1 Tax=Nonlabens sp. TaxID=1888209 RepID=UPI003265B8E9